jgi:hypothetical protein
LTFPIAAMASPTANEFQQSYPTSSISDIPVQPDAYHDSNAQTKLPSSPLTKTTRSATNG